jgi:hypothetical protein
MSKFVSICILLVAILLNDIAVAIPLDNWTTWSTNQPFVSKQVPPNALIARCKDLNTYCVIEVDQTTGEIPVALSGGSIAIDFSGPTGDPVPSDAGFVGGVDQNGDLRGLAVDTDGQLQVDILSSSPIDVNVLSSALPTGAATESTLGSINTKTPALGQTTMSGSTPVAIASDQSSIPVTQSGAWSVSQSGTWTVQPGNTANTTPWLTTIAQGGNSATVTAGGALTVTSGNLPSTVSTNVGAADSSTLRVTEGSRTYADSFNKDYTGGNVTTGAWVELIASTAAAINLLCLTDTSGQVMEIGTGAAASEARVFLIAQGWSGCIPLRIASGARVSVRAVTATASSGYLTLSGMN